MKLGLPPRVRIFFLPENYSSHYEELLGGKHFFIDVLLLLEDLHASLQHRYFHQRSRNLNAAPQILFSRFYFAM